MKSSIYRRVSLRAGALMVLAQLTLTGCGSTDMPTSPTDTVLLSTSVNFVSGVTCATGGVNVEFPGTASKVVVITASATAALTPRFTLYAPNFTTQLGGSVSTGAGTSSLTTTLTASGTHYVTLCDVNGIAGAVAVKVTQK